MVSVSVAVYLATDNTKDDREDQRGTADDSCEDKWRHVSDGAWEDCGNKAICGEGPLDDWDDRSWGSMVGENGCYAECFLGPGLNAEGRCLDLVLLLQLGSGGIVRGPRGELAGLLRLVVGYNNGRRAGRGLWCR